MTRLIENALTIEPDGDTISRQAAVAMFEKHCYPITYDKASREKGMTITGIREVIESLPSAPDSRQRGEWVWDEDAVDWGIGAWVCNKCGSRPQTWWSTDRNKNPLICAGSRFCGNCGADMRGDTE